MKRTSRYYQDCVYRILEKEQVPLSAKEIDARVSFSYVNVYAALKNLIYRGVVLYFRRRVYFSGPKTRFFFIKEDVVKHQKDVSGIHQDSEDSRQVLIDAIAIEKFLMTVGEGEELFFLIIQNSCKLTEARAKAAIKYLIENDVVDYKTKKQSSKVSSLTLDVFFWTGDELDPSVYQITNIPRKKKVVTNVKDKVVEYLIANDDGRTAYEITESIGCSNASVYLALQRLKTSGLVVETKRRSDFNCLNNVVFYKLNDAKSLE